MKSPTIPNTAFQRQTDELEPDSVLVTGKTVGNSTHEQNLLTTTVTVYSYTTTSRDSSIWSERLTEDQKVPGSNPGRGIPFLSVGV